MQRYTKIVICQVPTANFSKNFSRHDVFIPRNRLTLTILQRRQHFWKIYTFQNYIFQTYALLPTKRQSVPRRCPVSRPIPTQPSLYTFRTTAKKNHRNTPNFHFLHSRHIIYQSGHKSVPNRPEMPENGRYDIIHNFNLRENHGNKPNLSRYRISISG